MASRRRTKKPRTPSPPTASPPRARGPSPSRARRPTPAQLRAQAAERGWETRRANEAFARRSEAAQRGAETRRLRLLEEEQERQRRATRRTPPKRSATTKRPAVTKRPAETQTKRPAVTKHPATTKRPAASPVETKRPTAAPVVAPKRPAKPAPPKAKAKASTKRPAKRPAKRLAVVIPPESIVDAAIRRANSGRRLGVDALKLVQEKYKNCGSPATCKELRRLLREQEMLIGPTEKVKRTLRQLRQEAIKKKAGWFPKKLVDSKYVQGSANVSRDWMEERGKFKYRRAFKRVGVVLRQKDDNDLDEPFMVIYDRIRAEYMRLLHLSEKAAPIARGYVQLYGYTVARDGVDGTLANQYAEIVRYNPNKGRGHSIGRGSDDQKAISEDDLDLASLPGSSGISTDVRVVMDGVERVLMDWTYALDTPVIVDSYLISIEERQTPPPRR